MITIVYKNTKELENSSDFWQPDSNFITIRQRDFLDTGKMLSENVTYNTDGGTSNKVVTMTFPNIACYNDWTSANIVIMNRQATLTYNSEHNISSITQIT